MSWLAACRENRLSQHPNAGLRPARYNTRLGSHSSCLRLLAVKIHYPLDSCVRTDLLRLGRRQAAAPRNSSAGEVARVVIASDKSPYNSVADLEIAVKGPTAAERYDCRRNR